MVVLALLCFWAAAIIIWFMLLPGVGFLIWALLATAFLIILHPG